MKVKIILAVILAILILLLSFETTESYVKVAYANEVEVIKTKPPIKEYSKQRVTEVFGEGEWESFEYIVSKESENWTVYKAHYPSGYARIKQKDGTYKSVKSSAHGLCGFLNQTFIDTGFEKTDDPYKQIEACIVYVRDRYGSPHKAKLHHSLHNWF